MGGIRGPILMPSACFAIKYEYSKKTEYHFSQNSEGISQRRGFIPFWFACAKVLLFSQTSKKNTKKMG